MFLRFGTISVLDGYYHLVSPEPMNAPGVGMIVTMVALIGTMILVTFQRWVVRKTQSRAVRADTLHYQSDVMMNGAILVALALSATAGHRADALFALVIAFYIYIARYAWHMTRYSHY
ncbi:cation transporter [Shigella flexneri]